MAHDLQILLPEISLALYAILALLVFAYTAGDKGARLLSDLTSAVFVLLALWIAARDGGEAFGGMFVEDGVSRFAKALILGSAAAVLLIGRGYLERFDLLRFEYPVLVALAVLGMMVMVSARDIITLYLGVELQSLALYVIAALRKNAIRSTEAGLKYFILGALSSGLLLYGASLVYGFTGSTLFSRIGDAANGAGGLGLLFGLVFMMAGMAFKVSAAPFHMWTPDVYEGSPTAVTAFFAAAPKVAAIVMLARVLHEAFVNVPGDWRQIAALLAVLSMFVGSIGAIAQTNLKRLMAYSSIAHMGYALLGLAAGTQFGMQAMLVYMSIYVVMSVGVFAFVMSLSRDGVPVTEISALNSYAKTDPLKALAVLVLMFSLAGVPPMLGFFGKLYVLQAVVEAGMVWLAVLGVIASVIGAFYYLRIVYYMYFGSEAPIALDRVNQPVLTGALYLCALALILGLVNMFGVETLAAEAVVGFVR